MLAMRRRRSKKTTSADTQEAVESAESVPEPTDAGPEAEVTTPPSGEKPPAKKRSRKRRNRKKSSWTPEEFQVPEKDGETRFHDLELPDRIMHAIADLGFKYCTPIQAKVLVHAHAGQNISGRAQTGTGKTAAFLITIFSKFLKDPIQGERPTGSPRALVLVPRGNWQSRLSKTRMTWASTADSTAWRSTADWRSSGSSEGSTRVPSI